MKKQPKFERGDLVLVECGYEDQMLLGVIITEYRHNIYLPDGYQIASCGVEIINTTYFIHPSAITLISKGEFK